MSDIHIAVRKAPLNDCTDSITLQITLPRGDHTLLLANLIARADEAVHASLNRYAPGASTLTTSLSSLEKPCPASAT